MQETEPRIMDKDLYQGGCPYCGSKDFDFDGDYVNPDENTVTESYTCLDCARKWRLVHKFKLDHVELLDEPDKREDWY